MGQDIKSGLVGFEWRQAKKVLSAWSARVFPSRPSSPEVGQFWRDTVNRDVLKILGFTSHEEGLAEYVRCACYVRGEYLMGTQEMKVAHFETGRFERLGFLESLWMRLRHLSPI